MNTAALSTFDQAITVLVAMAWWAAGATAGSRPRMAAGLLVTGVILTATRVVDVVELGRSGWWFVREKVVLALPLLLVTAGVAAVLASLDLRSRRAVLAMLTTGYAAIGGFGATALSGFSAGWTTGLITLAVVGSASVATARLLGFSRLRSPATACATLAVLGVGLVGLNISTVDDGGAGAPRMTVPVSVDALVGASTPDEGGNVRRYTLTARTATLRLDSGRVTQAWLFDDQLPGPVITAVQGDLLEVTLVNVDISAGVTLHWHGYDVPGAEDGVPGLTQELVPPGQRYVYRFRAEQVGTYWYHTHEISDVGVRMGLYGVLVVRPRTQSRIIGVDLPVVVHTVDGSLVVGNRDGVDARAVPEGTPVRLRLVDTDDVAHLFALGGTTFRVVAVDGTDLNGPGPVAGERLRVPAGGRLDLEFIMPATPVVLGTDRAEPALALAAAPSGGVVPAILPSPVVSAPVADAWPVLDLLRYGTPATAPFGASSRFDREFTLVLDQGLAFGSGLPSFTYTVNGRAFPDTATLQVAYGDLVELTVVNRSSVVHPWHLHGHTALVLSRDGEPVTGSPLWMDTFEVRPGEVVRVAFRADNPGLWMIHCHNLAHAGMALNLDYAGVSSPRDDMSSATM